MRRKGREDEMKRILALAILATASTGALAQQAAAPTPPPYAPPAAPSPMPSVDVMAAACALCHGPEGKAVDMSINSLAGQPKNNMVNSLNQFRAGTKPGTIMTRIARGLSDAEIDAVASYYAARR